MSSSLRSRCASMLFSILLFLAAATAVTAQTSEPPRNRCAATATLDVSVGLPQWSGWGASPTQQRFQPAERARLSAEAVPKLTLK